MKAIYTSPEIELLETITDVITESIKQEQENNKGSWGEVY